jgi:hypothetical protein
VIVLKRRLYFLLPDNEHARALVGELESRGISRKFMHAIAGHGGDAGGLPVASQMQCSDAGARIERYLWGGNLALFFLALMALAVIALLPLAWWWLLLPGGIMLVSFLAGLEFVMHTPNVHLTEFQSAMRHREILLMIDVPAGQVADVEDLVHRRHPEAIAGGVGWSVDALHV